MPSKNKGLSVVGAEFRIHGVHMGRGDGRVLRENKRMEVIKVVPASNPRRKTQGGAADYVAKQIGLGNADEH